MDRSWWLCPLICALALTLSACACSTTPLSEQKAVDIAWDALEPNTSSHDLGNWEVIEARQVTGQEVEEVASRFGDRPAPGCSGPKPPANEEVSSSGTYWLITMRPRPATPWPEERPRGPTAGPLIPEPFVSYAAFLIDADRSQVVARQLYCVIY